MKHEFGWFLSQIGVFKKLKRRKITLLIITASERNEIMSEARDLVCQADRISKEQGFTQAEWCRRAGMDNVGVAVSRTFKRGDCKLSTMTRLLAPLGYKLSITKLDE